MHRRPVLALILAALVGLIGAGAAPSSATPPTEGELAGVRAVSAGNQHTCARLTNGQARCWGTNEDGQVGDDTTDERHLPTTVLRPDGAGPLTGVAQISAGFHTCARLTNGEARCWGPNFSGELGDGSTTERHLPVTVSIPGGATLTGVAQIAAGDGFSCARLTSGRVRCWGENQDRALGDGTTTDRHRAVFVTVPGGGKLTGATQLTVGRSHACVRTTAGQARCWGQNYGGALGDGTVVNRARATLVDNPVGTGPLGSVVQISAGDLSTCAVVAGREARCWGVNDAGQLGTGDEVDRHRPVPVRRVSGAGRLTDVVQVSVGQGIACARRGNGGARCWGVNSDGQLGTGGHGDSSRPVVVRNVLDSGPLLGLTSISAGGAHVCARVSSGQALCWGSNFQGQIGDNTTGEHLLPVAVQAG